MPVSPAHASIDWTTYGLAFADKLRDTRKRVGMTQEELQHRSGLSRNQIQNLENNRNNDGGPGNPSLRTLYQLAQALRVPVVVMLPTAGAVPPLRAVESAPDLASDGRGVEIDFEPWFHAAREALAAERSR